MKKIILILLFFIALGANAQGNLQFNRVVNFSASQSVANQSSITFQSFVVPNGKVWKIENVMVGKKFGAGNLTFCSDCAASFNEIISYACNLSGNYYENGKSPIWLSEGSYNFIIYNNYSSGTSILVASYSAIEFNVVP